LKEVKELSAGDSMKIGRYNLRMVKHDLGEGPNQ